MKTPQAAAADASTAPAVPDGKGETVSRLPASVQLQEARAVGRRPGSYRSLAQLFARAGTVVAACRLVTRSRANGTIVDAPAPMTPLGQVRDDLIVDFRPFYWNVPKYRAAIEALGANSAK